VLFGVLGKPRARMCVFDEVGLMVVFVVAMVTVLLRA
jgi:hypothetical protein